jgi:SpoVK/Ycf46/Vps4 family AAA+-type ATPase
VTFLLTTNRPEILESALAARPGRVDLAAELPLPDAAARQRLVRLYQGDVVLDLSEPERMIQRTDGVTASFLKELIRRRRYSRAKTAPAALPQTAAGPSPGPLRPSPSGSPMTI